MGKNSITEIRKICNAGTIQNQRTVTFVN